MYLAVKILGPKADSHVRLASVLAAYLLFRDEVLYVARAAIRFNHRISTWFQRVSAPERDHHQRLEVFISGH